MRKLIISTLSLLSILFLVACQADSAERKAEKIMRDEIYAIHDDVMPKNSEINRLKRQLKKFPEDKIPDPVVQQQIRETILQLEQADDGMMSWMNNFKEPAKLRSAKTHEEIMVYLENEKKTIAQVRTDMLESIVAAKALLASLNATPGK